MTGAMNELGFIVDARAGPSDLAYWWKPIGLGYTSDLNQAGQFTRAQYVATLPSAEMQAAHVFVPREVAWRAARRTVRFEDLRVDREETARARIREERMGETLRAVFG